MSRALLKGTSVVVQEVQVQLPTLKQLELSGGNDGLTTFWVSKLARYLSSSCGQKKVLQVYGTLLK